MIKIGIIGGSGFYQAELLRDAREIKVSTPFGDPSGKFIAGKYEGRDVIFLPRHGKGHAISPTEINVRANIFAFKKLGVTHLISASAVGSLREEIRPLDIVIPDQIYDRTKFRPSTFFEDGIVAHVKFGNPFCEDLRRLLIDAVSSKGLRFHPRGTYVCIEGPQFSTKAESEEYRKRGFDVIGMTAIPEAKLAREAEICYAIIATVTDYDVWKEKEVDVKTVIENMRRNVENVRDILCDVIPKIPEERRCECKDALRDAIVTDARIIPGKVKKRLRPLIEKYLP